MTFRRRENILEDSIIGKGGLPVHITLESDYAVRIVSCLAKNGGRMPGASPKKQA